MSNLTNIVIENWWVLLVIFAIGIVIGNYFNIFMNLPDNEKIEKIIQWLVWAVSVAEKKYGSGTGKLKLQEVYSMFVAQFPALSNQVTFEKFSEWVDEALKKFHEIADNNEKIKEIINPDLAPAKVEENVKEEKVEESTEEK